MANGIPSTQLETAGAVDELIANAGGKSVRTSPAGLANQMLATGPIADELSEVKAQITSGLVSKATFAELQVVTPDQDGTGGEVLDTDTGSHNQATATGYDGGSVSNAGRYSFNATWGRWVRTGDTGLSSRLSTDFLIDPFPLADFELPATFAVGDVQSPSSNIDFGAEIITIPNGSRLYLWSLLERLGFQTGDLIRMAFRVENGTPRPASLRFLSGSALVTAQSFALAGGHYVAEAVVPASADRINIDLSAASTGDVTITRPAMAVSRNSAKLPSINRVRFNEKLAEGANAANLWGGAISLATTAGSGQATDNGDGTFVIPAGANVEVQMSPGFFSIPVDQPVTMLAKLTSPAVRNARARMRGPSGAEYYDMAPIGGGWFLWSGVPAVAGQTQIVAATLVIDNRDWSLVSSNAAQVTVEQVLLVEGADIPARTQAAEVAPPVTETVLPTDTVVVTQATNTVRLHQVGSADDKYARWTFSRYDNASRRALGWRLTELATCTRTDRFDFTVDTVVTNPGEFEFAIQETGKSDFMGGETHGDMRELNPITFLLDGAPDAIDGVTSFEAKSFEAIQHAELLEVDNPTETRTGLLSTRWIWGEGKFRLAHFLEWTRSINIGSNYMAMLPVLRHVGGGSSGTLISKTALRGPDYAPEDMSVESHGMGFRHTPRAIVLGDTEFSADMEIVKGYGDTSEIYFEDTEFRNKFYAGHYAIGGVKAIASGDIVDWEAVYRVGVS